jgi:hypothetical protein
MRRLVLSIIVASGLVMVGAGSASAEPVPTTGAAKPVPGKKVCKIADAKLTALSGMVATKDGFVVVNDGVPEQSGRKIFFLNDACKIVKTVSFSGDGPLDTEDMALSADGETLWIADTGDNDKARNTVALWSMPADGSQQPTIHRLSYPDNDKHDAEALLVGADGSPIIITKETSKVSGVYVPTGPLKTKNTVGVPMRKAGQVTVPSSTTPASGVASLGRGMITGAAMAPGGGKVTLRTYTDALEFDVADRDVLAALKNKPRVTPLPNEPFGEAISYSADGTTFLTVSDMDNISGDVDNWILQYTPVAVTAKALSGGAAAKPGGKGQSWLEKLSLDDITWLVGGVGILGGVLVGLGIFGIVRSRKRAAKNPAEPAGTKGSPKDPPKGPKPLDVDAPTAKISLDEGRPADELQGAGQRGSGVYGGTRPPAGPGVYGAKPAPGAPPPGSGGVYGAGKPAGRPASGGVYGAPPPPAPAGPPPGGHPAGPTGRPPGPTGRPTGPTGRPPGPTGRPQGPTGRPPGPTGRPPGPPSGYQGHNGNPGHGGYPDQNGYGPGGQQAHGSAGHGSYGPAPQGQGPRGQGPQEHGRQGQGPQGQGPQGQGRQDHGQNGEGQNGFLQPRRRAEGPDDYSDNQNPRRPPQGY